MRTVTRKVGDGTVESMSGFGPSAAEIAAPVEDGDMPLIKMSESPIGAWGVR